MRYERVKDIIRLAVCLHGLAPSPRPPLYPMHDPRHDINCSLYVRAPGTDANTPRGGMTSPCSVAHCQVNTISEHTYSNAETKVGRRRKSKYRRWTLRIQSADECCFKHSTNCSRVQA